MVPPKDHNVPKEGEPNVQHIITHCLSKNKVFLSNKALTYLKDKCPNSFIFACLQKHMCWNEAAGRLGTKTV